MTELEQIAQTRLVDEWSPDVETVYLVDAEDGVIAAWMIRQENGRWTCGITAALHDEPTADDVTYEQGLVNLYNEDPDLLYAVSFFSLDLYIGEPTF